MSDCNQKVSGCNTQYAGMALAAGWFKREKLFRFLRRLPLNLKTVKRSPFSKLEDLLVCLMTGSESLGQIDIGMRNDPGLTLSLGRESLADQSLMSQTLDAFDEQSLTRQRSNIVRLLTRTE